ncbi:MAG: peptidoglycan editing factor PgeF [Phormidesmis sp.]
MQLWTWRTWQDKPFLTCGLLPQPHGFFTQHFYPAPPAELSAALLPSARIYQVKQVHSGDVLTPTEIEAAAVPLSSQESHQPPFPLADGIVSEQPEQAVWACSADCTPVLIGDLLTGKVAAVHAGWRGTAQKIVPAAVARFQAQGSQLRNLRIALGPAIHGNVYQVGRDVAAQVGLSVAPTSAPAAIIESLMAIENPPLFSDSQENRVRLDVRRINQMQLEQMGIASAQIAIAPHCTYQEPKNFFSYRRTGEKKVQWSGIVSV